MGMLIEVREFEESPEQQFHHSPHDNEGNKWKRKAKRQPGSSPGLPFCLVLCLSLLFPSRTNNFYPTS